MKVINTGRRPATVDHVYGIMQAPNVFRQVLWWWKKRATIPLERGDCTAEITEGSEKVFSCRKTG